MPCVQEMELKGALHTALPQPYMFSFLSLRKCQSQHSQRRGEEDVGGALAELAAVKGMGESLALRAFSLRGAHVSSLNPQDNPNRWAWLFLP